MTENLAIIEPKNVWYCDSDFEGLLEISEWGSNHATYARLERAMGMDFTDLEIIDFSNESVKVLTYKKWAERVEAGDARVQEILRAYDFGSKNV